MEAYSVESPVLLIAFNRPDTTLRVFNEIKIVKPRKLYIAADGPRAYVEADKQLCASTRKILDNIDWDCEVIRLFRQENLGCKIAVSGAISWFFNQEAEGIILEDDCLPCPDFFYFCDTMLKRYRNDTRMMNVTGTNLQEGRKWSDASYYFSRYTHIWGWASWRRAWALYDPDLERYGLENAARQLENIFTDRFLVAGWIDIFKKLKAGKIDSWDYQFNLVCFFENGLCITPEANLISNLGFRPDATHTKNVPVDHANLPFGHLQIPIVHPVYFIPEKEADYFFLKKDFLLEEKWRTFEKEKLMRRRFKRWLRRLLKFK